MRISFGFGVPDFKSKSGIQNPKLGTRNRMVAASPSYVSPATGERREGIRNSKKETRASYAFIVDERRAAP